MSFALEPLVAGQLGPRTDLDPSSHPPVVHAVEYVLDRPVDEDLIESFPVFLVSDDLARMFSEAALRGFSFDSAIVGPCEEYLAAYGDQPHKPYRWLRLEESESPDLWRGDDLRLCVSSRAMEVLERAKIPNCDVEPLSD